MSEKLLTNRKALMNMIRRIAVEAGNITLKHFDDAGYQGADTKADGSPVTLADQEAEAYIEAQLKKILPNILMIGEETASERKRADLSAHEYFWLVDPLDGTKEFISGSGEYTVNIALIKNNKPHLGIVYCPTQKTLYYNDHEKNVYKKVGEDITNLNKRNSVNESTEGLRVVVSRSHMSEETSEYVSKLIKPKLISCGSSLKFLYIADDKADIYPRFGPTMEWDTGAAHSILNALDIQVINLETGRELSYNKENLLNPHFIIKA